MPGAQDLFAPGDYIKGVRACMITTTAYVTFGDLFAYTLVIVTLIGIFTNKKK